jgi:hypothetical protein
MKNVQLRVARPTDNLDQVADMYREGLGFEALATFEDHDGFDGVILGVPGAQYHLEFTHRRGQMVGKAPTEDHLLVFYLPDSREWSDACDRMVRAGFRQVASFNPYWDRQGRTFEDVDGYRVVLQCASWGQ